MHFSCGNNGHLLSECKCHVCPTDCTTLMFPHWNKRFVAYSSALSHQEDFCSAGLGSCALPYKFVLSYLCPNKLFNVVPGFVLLCCNCFWVSNPFKLPPVIFCSHCSTAPKCLLHEKHLSQAWAECRPRRTPAPSLLVSYHPPRPSQDSGVVFLSPLLCKGKSWIILFCQVAQPSIFLFPPT